MLLVVFKNYLRSSGFKSFLAGLLLTGLAGCASNGAWLNSDRIEQAFGSYGVEVLRSEPQRRVTSLYSTDDAVRTTRTYAIVEFPATPGSAYAREHAEIEAGGSIGATFRQAGWAIDKRHLFIGELEITAKYQQIGEMMGVALPETLATHEYLMIVSKDERSYTYATITEIHHPDYLSAGDLGTIYGEIIFDDSNRDSIEDFIGPPNPPK